MLRTKLLGLLVIVGSLLFVGCVSSRDIDSTASPTVRATAVIEPIETLSPTETATAPPTAAATSTIDPYVVSYVATVDAQRSPDVPPLPFDDNPDPLQCGIPVTWTNDAPAWLSGYYEDELVRPTVFLYDSHLRLNIQAQAPHGSEVEVLLYQQNPVTDYYLVKIVGEDGVREGWVPAPFLSFEQPRNS